MISKRYLILEVVFLCGLLVTPSCGKKKPVKVGFVGGLTGRVSQLSVSARNGVILSIENANRTGGINGRLIELIIKNDENDPGVAVKVDKELIEEGAVAIIGHITSNMASSALTAIKDENVLMISPTMSTPILGGIDDNLIRTCPTNSTQALTIAGTVLKEGIKKIAIVYDLSNRQYTEEIFVTFKDEFIKNGGRIVYLKTIGTCEKLCDIADEMKGSDPDGFLAITSAIDAAILAQHIRKTGSNINLYACSWAQTLDLIQHGGEAVEGMVLVSMYINPVKSPGYLEFKKQYKEMFNEEVSFVTVMAYDAAEVLLTGMRESKRLDPDSIKDTILRIGTFEGLEDTFRIDEYGDTARPYSLFIVTRGQFVLMESK